MSKNKLKKLLFIAFVLLFCIYYILFPAQVSTCAKAGIMLWFNQIFPLLFIFTILSNLIISTNVLQNIPQKHIMLFTYIIGIIFGFPIGAKLTADFCSKGYIDKNHREILSALANHFSIYLVSLYLPSAIGMIAMLSINKNRSLKQKIPAQGFKLNMQIVDAGIMKGFETLIKLCGYIVLFSIVSRIPQIIAQKADCSMPLSADIIGAFFETTNGIGIVCGLCIPRTLSIVLCIALLSFGGVSCMVQTKSIFRDTGFRLYRYILLKAAMSILSCLLCIILFCILI